MTDRMNRRAAKQTLLIDLGHLAPADLNYGLPVNCYACGMGHTAKGVARFTEGKKQTHVPICEPCLANEGTDNLLARKYLQAPDMKITAGLAAMPTKH